MADGGAGGGDGGFEVRDGVTRFPDYEAYLSSQISDVDSAYLDGEDTARALIELGYRGPGDTLKREEWEARVKADREKHLHRDVAPKPLASVGKEREMAGKPFLLALAAREELVRNGKLTCIIFLRDVNAKGQEVSGYIDYAARLRTDPFEAIFEGRARLQPRPSDLSYYNWETQATAGQSSVNYAVLADGEVGLLFKNKRDRKVVNVDPAAPPGDNTTRTEIRTPEYAQVVIYDHFSRRKG